MKAAIFVVAVIGFLAYVGWDGHKDNVEQAGIRAEIAQLEVSAAQSTKDMAEADKKEAEVQELAKLQTNAIHHYCSEHEWEDQCNAIRQSSHLPVAVVIVPRYSREPSFMPGMGRGGRDMLP